MKQLAHTITLQPGRCLSFGERFAINMATTLLWPLHLDERMTTLINLLAIEIYDITENEDQIDAIVDSLRLQLKINRQSH